MIYILVIKVLLHIYDGVSVSNTYTKRYVKKNQWYYHQPSLNKNSTTRFSISATPYSISSSVGKDKIMISVSKLLRSYSTLFSNLARFHPHTCYQRNFYPLYDVGMWQNSPSSPEQFLKNSLGTA